jgi:hypothetical protein
MVMFNHFVVGVDVFLFPGITCRVIHIESLRDFVSKKTGYDKIGF